MSRKTVRRHVGNRWQVTWAVALAVGVPLVGCASFPGTSGQAATGAGPGSTASPMQHPTLEGIPVPAGFSLVTERSFGWSSGQLRHASCEFVGETDPMTANRFYKEYMPSAGFTLRQERLNRGEYILEFDSTAERSTVRIRRDRFKTVLVIDVNPTPKGSAEREAKPPVRRP